MHEYDTTLKTLLTRPGCGLLASVTGCSMDQWSKIQWHNVELPEVRSLRVDLLGELAPGKLIHIELQRSNDPTMVFRMAEYALSIHRSYGHWPVQFVLYIGDAPMRMPARLETDSITFACRMLDIREFDAEPLIRSPHLEDNIIAILARLRNDRESVRRILEQIAVSDPTGRGLALKELTMLAGLRKLESVIGQETRKMPILDDIMDHDLLGPAIRQGLEQGREEGREEGERKLLRIMIEERFGPVPAWAMQRVDSLTQPELERMCRKILVSCSLEELLG